MIRILIFILFISFSVQGQKYIFKIRKRPKLEFFLFADGFFETDLNNKSKQRVDFGERIYIQLYANDTFLIRWNNHDLKEALVEQNYFSRDSNTIVGAYRNTSEDRIKLSFPYKGKTYNLFDMNVEPLIQKNTYKISKTSNKKRVSYSFTYENKVNILADVDEKNSDAIFEFDELQTLSKKITFGFYSDDLYNDTKDQNVPLNIVETYPARLILDYSSCHSTLFWNGVQTTRTIQQKDTTFLKSIPEDNIISMSGSNVTYYSNRRYVYLHNDSQLVVTDLNRSCDFFFEEIDTVNNLTPTLISKQKDGVKDFLVKLPQKNRYGWVSTYGCAVKWKILEIKKADDLIEEQGIETFKHLQSLPSLSEAILSEYCEFEKNTPKPLSAK